jgi:hypothetical protein
VDDRTAVERISENLGGISSTLAAHGYRDFEAAACNLRVLTVVLIVAIVSYCMKSRLAFVFGSLGSLLGYVTPARRIHVNGTAEAVWMENIKNSAEHFLISGLFGATLGITLAAIIVRLYKQVDFETSDDA